MSDQMGTLSDEQIHVFLEKDEVATRFSGPGALLKSQRILQNQRIEDIAAYLGVSQTMVEIIESDDLDSPLLRSKQDLIACYIKYATYLDIAREEVLRLYEQRVNEVFPYEEKSFSPALPSYKSKFRWFAALAILLCVSEFAHWIYQKSSDSEAFNLAAQNAKTMEDTIQDMVMSELQAEELSHHQLQKNKS
ncbi:hypothetical protein CC99x_007340 [Candidatus Berkiella cookevillensis]|uniref:Uncharacterized protein n=1 Tax=Candidatus Berkiella cookevillensis TaxID=437022 RepID=A0A0Q9YCG9_9GAMM|nr:hypothetical protein [Candidatus Berkiella cookevillensis]MCS5708716.1 hypothetical protein [Candidatus Berkiella cookevillensis]